MEGKEYASLNWESYVERTAAIRLLSSPQIDNSMTASFYYEKLVHNFSEIRELSKENRELLVKEIFPLLRRDGGPLAPEVVEQLREFEHELLDAYNMENLDLSLMAALAERLHGDALMKGDMAYIIEQLDAKIMVYYAIMNMMSRSKECAELCASYRAKAKEAGRQLYSYLDPTKFAALPDSAKSIVLVNARYIAVLYDRELGELAKREMLDYIHRALDLENNAFYKEQLPNYDWVYHRMRSLEYAGHMTEYANEKQLNKEEATYVYECMENLYTLWKEHDYLHGKMTEAEILLILHRCKYYAGLCSKAQYKEKLLEVYEMRNIKDYNISSLYINLLLPQEFHLVLKGDHFRENEIQQIEDFYHNIISYIMRMPNSGSLSYMMEYLTEYQKNFQGIVGGDSFEEMCLNCMATVHPPTYVHSVMTGKLARFFAGNLLENDPALFVGTLPGCDTVDGVIEHRRELIDYAYHCGICHDIGKMPLVDTVFIYGRNLTEEEFKLIKLHPEIGASLLANRHRVSAYADVARGHHRWYNNASGYPSNFDTRTSRYKVFIDIVSMADCLDAATDAVGRSYTSSKTLDMFIQEVNQVSGTRYAPYFKSLFEDPLCVEELEFLLDKGRKRVYYETFLRLKDLKLRAEEG